MQVQLVLSDHVQMRRGISPICAYDFFATNTDAVSDAISGIFAPKGEKWVVLVLTCR